VAVIAFFNKPILKQVDINHGEFVLSFKPKETIFLAALKEKFNFALG